jgi:hypothetical protein
VARMPSIRPTIGFRRSSDCEITSPAINGKLTKETETSFSGRIFDAIVLNVQKYNQTVLTNSLGPSICVCSNWSLV